MKKLWELVKALWEKVKKWFKETALDWIKKGWLHALNVVVILFAYGKLDDCGSKAAGWVGFYGFLLLGYWIFWKFLGADKVVKKFIEERKKNKVQ
jgi:hypothetical protein